MRDGDLAAAALAARHAAAGEAEPDFDRDTAVTPLGEGAFGARLSAAWSTPRGPNGGYVAAVMVRAMEAAVADPARAPRSVTVHFLRPPAEAEVRIAVTVERAGRRMSTLTARLEQEGRLCAIALGAFGEDFEEAVRYCDAMPAAPAPETLEARDVNPLAPPIAQRFSARPVFGPPPFSGADVALTGGWMALERPRPLDAAGVALFTDCWMPAAWTRLQAPTFAPTIDLTIHFRAPLPRASAFVLGRFRSQVAEAGYFEEDGELWTPDGVLVAQSRQLGLLLPPAPPVS